ncbi:MAG: leucine-rich repeat domain-containing protein [Selenomonadaceae bacterium]|nr:leucine-rich repeat domain-containing protein [Selenomonadaceae bacterium]
MDTNELKKIGAQTLIISLKVCEDSLKNGAAYGAKLDFHSAIREFTTVIDLFPQLVQLMENLNLPAGTKEEVALTISDIACKAYLGRSVSYMQIGEKGKGNADKIMSDKIIAILPSQGENLKMNNLNYTQHAETVDFQRTQFTNSSNDMASIDFEYTRIGSGIEIKKYIGSATYVIIPNYIDDLPVISIGEKAFYNCKSLKSIQIPNSVTSIGNSAFSTCKSLISIEIPNSVTSIGEFAFGFCESLTSIQIPNSVTSIGNSAFSFCESLVSIKIPNSVTSIGEFAFNGCKSLTSIQIPNSVTSIGNNAFSWCRSLVSIKIPNSVISIGKEAFNSCESLTSIEIPNSVTSIGEYAFSYCKSLTSVRILNPNTIIGKNAFNDCNRALSILRGADTSAEINKEITQNTSSSYNTSVKKDDDVPLSKALFWTAIVIFIIAALIAYFTGISFGKSLLITAVGIFGLIIWCGSKFSK